MPFRSTSAWWPSAAWRGSDASGARPPWTQLCWSSCALLSSRWSGSSTARTFSPSICVRRRRGCRPPPGSMSSCWFSRRSRRRRWRRWLQSSSSERRLFAPSSRCSPHESSAATRYRWQAKRFLFEGYWSCLNLIYVWQQTSTPTLFFPLRRPKSVIVPETYSHLWLCAFHNRVSREKWKAFSMAQGNSQLWKQLLCPNHSQVLIIFVFMQEKSDLKLLSRWCQLVAISVFFFYLKRKANPSAISSHVCECCPCRLFITQIKKSFLSSSGEQLALTWLGCSQGNRYSVSWEHVVARCALEAQLTELVQLLIARPCACVLWGPLLLWCHISTTWTHTAVFED